MLGGKKERKILEFQQLRVVAKFLNKSLATATEGWCSHVAEVNYGLNMMNSAIYNVC